MIFNNLPLVSWNWGIIGAIFMLLVFLGLIVVLLIFLRGGKKSDETTT